MTIPYYNQINNKMNNNMPLYISNNGNLIRCISNHKGNNFEYSFNHGLEYLGLIQSVNRNGDNKNILEERIKDLKYSLEILDKECTRENEYLFYKYYNFIRERFFEYKNNKRFISKEQIEDLKQLTDADISIYRSFINIKNNVDIKKEIIGYSTKEIFGVSKGLNSIMDISDLNLKQLLTNKDDLLVQFMDFDKIETTQYKTITTSKLNVNESFFNYLIMDYDIYQIPKYIIDKQNRSIKNIQCDLISNSSKERQFEEEIKLIKKYIPIDKRIDYMK